MINNTGRSALKRTATAGPSGPVKRRIPSPTAEKVACDGDVVRAGGNVEVNNSDRHWEETLASTPLPPPSSPLVVSFTQADNALLTANNVVSSPTVDEPYLSSSPPPHTADPYSEFGDFPYQIDFVTSYLAMTRKRRFSSGKILEDHIFHKVRPTPPNKKWLHGNPILQWIIDLKDEVVATWFTKAEKAELQSWGPPLPLRDPAFEYAVGRFPKVSTPLRLPLPYSHVQVPNSSEQLWDIIESPSRAPNVPYDRARHSTATYVNSAAGSMSVPLLSLLSSHALTPPTAASPRLNRIPPAPGSAPKPSTKVGSAATSGAL